MMGGRPRGRYNVLLPVVTSPLGRQRAQEPTPAPTHLLHGFSLAFVVLIICTLLVLLCYLLSARTSSVPCFRKPPLFLFDLVLSIDALPDNSLYPKLGNTCNQ
ncbi:hypothetical protein PENSPDRAFT_168634 [Peniophora sp. CONT]|nr:hypothetical protein PENSPDRAFT_168634 [Peniophora sp. CONT]